MAQQWKKETFSPYFTMFTIQYVHYELSKLLNVTKNNTFQRFKQKLLFKNLNLN